MSLNNTLRSIIVAILLLILTLSPLHILLLQPEPAVAQTTECAVMGGGIEIRYDDGVPVDRMLLHGGCPSCSRFQGVLFELPAGIPLATLTQAVIYAGGGKGKLKVHVVSTDAEYITDAASPLFIQVSGDDWYTVQFPNILVPQSFWIVVERLGGSWTESYVEPYYDLKWSGHSANGETPELYTKQAEVQGDPEGDYLIRATVVPSVEVGKGPSYAYNSIQEAIDKVSIPGVNIYVYEGTYDETITVNKTLSIVAVGGPTKTVVQASGTTKDVFRITANCVRLSGFSIRGAATSGAGAGVRIDQASGCVISGNLIQTNGYGIYVSANSADNILLENECILNNNGIYVDGSHNYLSGNKLHGNTAPVGSAVFLSSTAADNQLRFNSITVDPGTPPAVTASAQLYNQNINEQVSAVENWWGTDTGPVNGGGQGPAVGDMVVYEPWLTRQPLRVKTAAASPGDFTMAAKDEMSILVLKQGAGTAFVSAASFGENPFEKFPGKPMAWTDVLLSTADGIEQVEVRVFYTAEQLKALGLKEGSLKIFWWNGEKWKSCSKTGVVKKSDFVWARFDLLKTKPAVSDLSGTMFAAGVPKKGFAWWLIPLIIVFVLIALVILRLFWVLVVKRERYTVE